MRAIQNKPNCYRSPQSGFSMIEVLVSLLIIATAMLGAAGIQLRALQLGQGSLFRTQAILLADDLAERMEANKIAATDSSTANGLYGLAATSTLPSTAPSCTSACGASDMAKLDLYQWQILVPSLLPQSSWSVSQTVSGNPSTYQITVNWVDSRGDSSAQTSTSAVTYSYVATRTIYLP